MQDAPYPAAPSGSRKLEKTQTPGIYRRGGRYVVVVRADGRQVKRFARTLAEARAIKSSIAADLARGEYRPATKLTVADYFREWLPGYAGRTSRGLRENTRDGYGAMMENHVLPRLGRVRLSELEQRHLKALATSLAEQGLARNTIRLALAPLRAMLATAVEEGVLRHNPAVGLRLALPGRDVEHEPVKVKALTEAELRRLLDELPPAWRLLFELMAHTGVRIGEAVALQWQHVDLGRRRLLVRRRWYRGSYAAPKSRYGRRDVPLTAGMARALWEQRKEARSGDEALVFPNAKGGPLDTVNLYNRVYRPAGKRAGVPWATFHTLRHTCATALFRHGYNPKQVQGWLGHHAASFTIDTYIHLLPDDLAAAEFFDALTAVEPVTAATDQATRARGAPGAALSGSHVGENV